MDTALGIIEFSSIPAGYRTYNRILKNVHISIRKDLVAAPGKLVIMFEGEHAGVLYAIEQAVNESPAAIFDYSLIGNLNAGLAEYLCSGKPEASPDFNDIGLIETESICSGIELANRLLHGTPVQLVRLNYGIEMHGRCLVAVGGSISSVQAALEIAESGELISNAEKDIIMSITCMTETA